MNKFIPAAVIAAAFALPAISFAQGTTRADVRAQLVQLEQAGYNPSANDVNYPHDLQVAQARVNEQQLAAGNTSGYGAAAAGTSQAGAAVRPAPVATQQSVYFGK